MIDAQDVALIVEGGGMRNSYTAPAIVRLIEQVKFGWVGGVSAGAVHALNYASADVRRARAAFTELASHPHFGGVLKLARGKGYFNSEFLYGQAEQLLPFDFATFAASSTQVHVEAMRADTGDTVSWGRDDFLRDPSLVARAARASSTVPKVMPITLIDAAPYVDGALGTSGGLLIDAARRAGFTRFVVLATRPRDYWKKPLVQPAAVRGMFRRYPEIGNALHVRAGRYNAAKREILAAERAGDALVFFPDNMQAESIERRPSKLQSNYAAGQAQLEREWERWVEFLAAPAPSLR
ncbi:patatin family protein [Corynebacterium sp. NML 150383]|uniref:patatin-like phospholipase family protein n=1 Tax=unclassified Corynebacterium TaxID=2624378 RepID=UPI000BAA7B3A|nr:MULTISPECIES: patatin family protein [unclassified Corynebacterium]PAT04831.1 patatin family protein [Corynebacterium sp. NML 150383]TVX80341.1 patatin family protein [Corynebacterium sp. NML180780]